MTFDELYHDAPVWFQPPPVNADDDGVMKVEQERPCWNCQKPTAYVDLAFEAHLCSESCRDVKWADYFTALHRTPMRPVDESEDVW